MKVFNTSAMVEANREAIRKRFNRTLSVQFIRRLDPNGFHVVYSAFDHNDGQCLRLIVLCKVTGSDAPLSAVLDCTYERYDQLPTTDDILEATKK